MSSSTTSGHLICENNAIGPLYLRQQIASGSTCTVWRALRPPKEFYAVKYIALPSKHDDASIKKLMREVKIHETLRHKNILQMLGGEQREREPGWERGLFIVMTLASGGDLFDKIPPDRGLPWELAHLYFCQLLSGLKYLLANGICHRDIKPENLLLSTKGNLLITDFGLASVYKYKGKTRPLSERCGSPPYAAPELATTEPYSGEPIDVWSSGVVLFALLVGNTPWDEPTSASPEFAAYLTGEIWQYEPWHRIRGSAKVLLKGLLTVDPKKRFTIAKLELNDWVRQPNPLQNPKTGQCADQMTLTNQLTTNLRDGGYLGAPQPVFEDLCELMVETKLSSQAGVKSSSEGMEVDDESEALDENTPLPTTRLSQASQKIIAENKISLSQSTGFQSSMRLYSRLSLAPSQRNNPHTDRFFSTLSVPALLHHLSTSLTTQGVQHQLLSQYDQPLSLSSLPPASSFTLPPTASTQGHLARLRFEIKDHRGQLYNASIGLSNGFLPATDQEEEVQGIDVALFKKFGEPLFSKKLWKTVVEGLDRGVVFTT